MRVLHEGKRVVSVQPSLLHFNFNIYGGVMSKELSVNILLGDCDMSSPHFYLRPDLNSVWQRLRENHPIIWHHELGDKPGFWVVTSYQEAVSIYKNSEVFSSSKGNIMDTLLYGGDTAGGQMLPVSDGERHSKLRKAILSYFTSSKLSQIKIKIERDLCDILKNVVERKEFDFAEEVSNLVPILTICEIFGVPVADRKFLYANASKCISSKHVSSQKNESLMARNELLMYFLRFYKSQKKDQSHSDDLMNYLIGLCDSDIKMTQEELVYNCYSLLLGGDETTRLTLTGLCKLICDFPKLWEDIKEERINLSIASNEVLRWTSVARHAGRTVMMTHDLSGQRIECGELVFVFNCSANFDENVFLEPSRPDLGRAPNKHLSFGYGAHFCLGANLARIEIEALISAMRVLINDIKIISPPQPVYSTFLSGFHSLPVRVS